jgi:phospholipase C
VYHWTTYPERLQKAGISWQVYANDEVGDGTDGYVGDYGDNPLWLFQAYHDALASTDPAVHQLADRASLRTAWLPDSGQGQHVDHVIAQFTADCASGNLPAVSWVVAPYAYCEHPAARPVDGEVYVQAVLNALWSNPKLAENTVVFINYDENDGFYDHVLPPVPPSGTANEFLPASQPLEGGFPPPFGPLVPIGLGPRVPMTVISPWSRGGWVNSQVFDHTSVLRFLETWTGVQEPNISAWRRAVCGDLTGCFDFDNKNTTIPVLPDTAGLQAQANATQSKLPKPTPPASGTQTMPVQDPGSAPARPLPYQANANVAIGSAVTVTMTNAGTQTVPLALYAHHLLSADSTPFDVAPGATASTTVPLDAITSAYNVYLYGPNGFLRHATGAPNHVEATLTITSGLALQLDVANTSAQIRIALIRELNGTTHTVTLAANSSQRLTFQPFAGDNGWYDLSVTVDGYPSYLRRFAGHLENGNPSVTG